MSEQHAGDVAQMVDTRCRWIEAQLLGLAKRGALVQLSGGIDSTVVVHLCARALGPENVVALYLPDTSTGPETRDFVVAAAENAGVELIETSIGPAIEAQSPAAGITALLQKYAPDYDPAVHAYAVNTNPGLARRLGALIYQVRIGPRHGEPERTLKMTVEDLRSIIAYQNRKQRTRMLFAYAEAEARNYAVVGASNGDELETGFVVKYGDDAGDIYPIGDLTKPQVYDVARELGVPEQIIARPPTTDTYALKQTQEDYYYALPASVLRALAAIPAEELDDDERLTPFLESLSGWTPEALRQVTIGLQASLRYQRTRSLRMS